MPATTVILWLARSVHLGSAMALVALPYFVFFVLAPAGSHGNAHPFSAFVRRLTFWLWTALGLEAISGLVWFWMVAVQLGDSPPGCLPAWSDLNALLWQTRFGHLWLGRSAVGAGVGWVVYLVTRRGMINSPGKSLPLGMLLVASSLLLVSLAWAGHAAAGVGHRGVHLTVDVLHLLLGAIWPLGLWPLGLWLGCARAEYFKFSDEIEMAVLRQFSRHSFLAVLLLLGTGLVNSLFMIGSWMALFTTVYGALLLGKVAVVVLMLALGACNRRRLQAQAQPGPSCGRFFRRTVLVESCCACLVLLLVGLMGMTSPPSQAAIPFP